MEKLFTIGFTRKSLKRFIALLTEHGVDVVVDVRRHNTSQLAGFAKREDLEYLLAAIAGIQYVPAPDLAPTAEMLAQLRRDRDWPRYEEAFTARMEAESMVGRALKILDDHARPCLLCSEHTPDQCHRRLLAEGLQAARPDLEICHLR